MRKRKMSYLDCILASTGHTLAYLKEHAVMDGQVIDHGEGGNCRCVDTENGNGDGLHFQCACSKWIRWAYPVRLLEEEEVFYFGSTCIDNWRTKCPDCKAVVPFEGVRTNTIDQSYRCIACDKTFFERRRKEQKKERAKKRQPPKPKRQPVEEWECDACRDTGVSYWSDDVYGACLECCCINCEEFDKNCKCRRTPLVVAPPPPPTHRACVDCKKNTIAIELPAHRIRCVPCYVAFKNQPVRKRLTM